MTILVGSTSSTHRSLPVLRSGAAQAAFLTVVLYTVATQLDGFFAAQQLPGQYTARNISVTVRTIVQVRCCAGCAIGFARLRSAGLSDMFTLADDSDLSKCDCEHVENRT